MSDQRIMVVTGASTGVGRAACVHFSNKGYTVCALARSVDKLSQVAAEGAGRIYSYPTDVSDAMQVEKTFTQILNEHNRVDILINNAGITTGKKPVDFQLIDQVIDTNLKGTLYCSFAALPSMRKPGMDAL